MKNWIAAVDYRRFVWIFSGPLMTVLAIGVTLWPAREDSWLLSKQGTAAVNIATTIFVAAFATTLVQQALAYRSLRVKLEATVRAHAGEVVEVEDGLLSWTTATPLGSWHLAYNSLLVQGRRPTTLVLPEIPEVGSPIWTDPSAQFRVIEHLKAAAIRGRGWFDGSVIVALADAYCRAGFTQGVYGREVFMGRSFKWTRQNSVLTLLAPKTGPYTIELNLVAPFADGNLNIEARLHDQIIVQNVSPVSRDLQHPMTVKIPLILKSGRNDVGLTSGWSERQLGPNDGRIAAYISMIPIKVVGQ